jgi:hypothetical protein
MGQFGCVDFAALSELSRATLAGQQFIACQIVKVIWVLWSMRACDVSLSEQGCALFLNQLKKWV